MLLSLLFPLANQPGDSSQVFRRNQARFSQEQRGLAVIWGENEYVIGLAAGYMYLVNAATEPIHEPEGVGAR
jgi:hypothetical protein